MSWIWIIILEEPKVEFQEGGILSGPAASLPFIFFIADCDSLIRSGAQLSSSTDGLSVSVTVGLWHIGFADPGVVVNEDVGFRFNISDGSAVVGHTFIRRVGIRSTIETLNNFPHVRTVGIGHRVSEKIFPTFCFGLVDCLSSFTTSVYPLLAILMDRLTEAISLADFGLHMWSHQRFGSLTGFRFFNVSSSCRNKDVIEARKSKR